MPNLLTDLSYAKPMNTYAGQPVQEIKDLNDTLDTRYKTNRANGDKLELLAFNTKTLDKDNHLKQQAFNDVNEGLSNFDYGNDWENADEKVRGLAKDFAMNQGLTKAKENKIAKDTGQAKLQERVEKGEILQEWADVEMIKASENYTGVYKDEETGMFKGSYNINRPPNYIDIGAKMWDYAKDVQEGKEPLYLTQADGTKKFIVHTEKGYLFKGSEEAVPANKIQSALRGMIMNNTEYKAQIKYENDLTKFKLTRTGSKEQPNRPLNSQDVQSLVDTKNISQEDLDIALSSYGESVTVQEIEQSGQIEGLFDGIMYGKKVDSYINPASVGQSYSKIDISSIIDIQSKDALTYQRKKADELAKENADKETIILTSRGNKIANPTSINSDLENGKLGIETDIELENDKVNSLKKQLVNSYKIIDNPKASAKDKELAERSAEQTLRDLHLSENRVDYLNEVNTTQYYKHLLENEKISKEDYNELTTGKSPRLTKLNNSRKSLNEKLPKGVEYNFNNFEGKRNYSLKELESMIKDPNKKGLAKMVAKIKFNDPEINKEWSSWVSSLTYEQNKESIINDKSVKQAYLKDDKEMAYTPAVYDFSTNVKNPEKLSYISQTLSNHVVRNKNAYAIYGQDGQLAELESKDSPYYKQNEIDVTGMTDYIPGQGYMLKGLVRMQKLNSKTGKLEYTDEQHEILLKPKSGNQEARQLVQQALRKDYARWNKSGGDAKFGNGVEYANAILRDEIEAQSDKFRKTKIYEGEKQNQTYFLGKDLNARVTKEMVNGQEYYTAFLEKYDTKRTILAGDPDAPLIEATGTANKIVFNDLISLENALEEVERTHGELDLYNAKEVVTNENYNNEPSDESYGHGNDYFGKRKDAPQKKKINNIENPNLSNIKVNEFITKYENFEYGDKAGSKGEDNKIDCSGLVCKYIEDKGLSENYKSDKSSQGLWVQSNNKQKFKSKDEFLSSIDNITNETLIAFSTGDSLSDNRKYGIDHIGIVFIGDNNEKYIVESSSGKKGVTTTLLEDRVKEMRLKDTKGHGVIFTGSIK